MRTQACLVRRACAGGPHLAGGTPASGQGRRGHGGNASCRGRQDRGPEACAWKRAHGPRRQGRGRAQAGPDAEPWAEVNCPGDGARRLSSRSHKKGSPALGTRGWVRGRAFCWMMRGFPRWTGTSLLEFHACCPWDWKPWVELERRTSWVHGQGRVKWAQSVCFRIHTLPGATGGTKEHPPCGTFS